MATPEVETMPATRSIESIDDETEVEYEDGADGHSMETIMKGGEGRSVTYDDIIMLPGFIDFGVAEVCVWFCFLHLNLTLGFPDQ